MKDSLKLLTKDYFNRHPVKEFSAARFEYSILLNPKVFGGAEDAVMPKLYGSLVEKGLAPDTSSQKQQIEQEEDTQKLLRMFRMELPPDVSTPLVQKLICREDEVLPEIQRIILKTFKDHTIENCVHFFTWCKTNCSDWIVQNLAHVREPYAQSMLCLVLGFRADTDAIPFLMEQVERFEKRFPEETFDQGPLMALYEIQARAKEGKI